MKTNRIPILHLVAFQTNLLLAHWKADTIDNTHKALGDLYSIVSEKIDELAEVTMGKDRDRDFPAETFEVVPNMPLSELLEFGLSAVTSYRATCAIGMDDDVLNIVAEISGAINHARYFLRCDEVIMRSE